MCVVWVPRAFRKSNHKPGEGVDWPLVHLGPQPLNKNISQVNRKSSGYAPFRRIFYLLPILLRRISVDGPKFGSPIIYHVKQIIYDSWKPLLSSGNGWIDHQFQNRKFSLFQTASQKTEVQNTCFSLGLLKHLQQIHLVSPHFLLFNVFHRPNSFPLIGSTGLCDKGWTK